MKQKNIKYPIILVLLILVGACSEEFLELNPSNSQSPDKITTINDAKVVLNGAYNLLQSSGYYNSDYLSYNDVRANDMECIKNGRLKDEYLYEYSTDNSRSEMWEIPYAVLRHVNNLLNILEGITAETESEQETIDDIKGQALTIRALAHFDLCKVYGKPYTVDNGASLGVPIIDEVVDPKSKLTRNTVAEVYTIVIQDLEDAILLLSDQITNGKLNVWGAKSLLARVYLYQGEDELAYQQAVEVITEGPYKLITNEDYADSWAQNYTSESIFSINNSIDDGGDLECIALLSDPSGYGPYAASLEFIELMEEDTNDVRNALFARDRIGEQGRILKFPGEGNTPAVIRAHEENPADNPLVNPTSTANVPVIRLSELYLIAAEAYIKEELPSNAQTYLNAIVERANPDTTVLLADVTLDRVLLERRKELVAEGHRFFDLIRNQRDIHRIYPSRYEGMSEPPYHIPHTDNMIVFPIPQIELNVNTEIEQNDGYDD